MQRFSTFTIGQRVDHEKGDENGFAYLQFGFDPGSVCVAKCLFTGSLKKANKACTKGLLLLVQLRAFTRHTKRAMATRQWHNQHKITLPKANITMENHQA